MICNLCPKNCNVDRKTAQGACLCGENAVVSRIGTHMWEEPCISGEKGSGTVFFAGCNLRCRFCQNYDISRAPKGVELTTERLADVLLCVGESGVANINLVSPSQYSHVIAQALQKVKPFLKVPVVYNTNGYEKVQALQKLQGLVDVYLPDIKFCDSTLAKNMCGCSDYFEVAKNAVCEMFRQQPKTVFDEHGYVKNGVIVRHLVLPSHVEDSKKVLDFCATVSPDMYVSLMSQYFPTHDDKVFAELNRKLYKHEYENAKQYFFNLGLHNGYTQEVTSATKDYVPDFNTTLVENFLAKVPRLF